MGGSSFFSGNAADYPVIAESGDSPSFYDGGPLEQIDPTLTAQFASQAAASATAAHTSETNAASSLSTLLSALSGYVTTTALTTSLASLVNSSPSTLDTLKELADALGDDPNFATTVTTSLSNRLRVDAAQGLTTAQKVQARSNAYAAPFDALQQSNIIINGNCDIAQLFGTTGITAPLGTFSYFADMVQVFPNQAAATAVVTAKQLPAASFPVALPGYNFGAQLQATTALTTAANGDFCLYRYNIEGTRVAKLGFGTASASAVSYGFWLYSTVSGVIFSTLYNAASNRFYSIENTVGAGWTWCTGTIPGDTSGTWVTNSGLSMVFQIYVAAKAASVQAPGSWSATQANQTTNSTNLLGTNGNQTIITGFVMIPGSEVPSSTRAALMMRPAAEELILCQRYLYVVAPGSVGAPTFCGGVSGLTGYFPVLFPQPMRITPTLSLSAVGDWNVNPFSSPGTQQNGTSVAFGITTAVSTRIHLTTPSTSAPTGAMAELNTTTTTAKFIAKAQL